MNFEKALQAMREGKKVQRSEMNEWIELGEVYTSNDPPEQFKHLVIRDETEASIRYWEPEQEDLLAEDWEVIEYIPEVKIQISISENFTCPSCKTSDEYWSSSKDKFKDLGFFKCGKCGQKLKAVVQTDNEILDYISVELDRYLNSDHEILMKLVTEPPDLITLTDNGKSVKFARKN